MEQQMEGGFVHLEKGLTPGVNDRQVDGAHYKQMKIQPWDIIEAHNLDYFEGAALKYLLRWRHKDGMIDLDKAIHYLEKIKERATMGKYGEEFAIDVASERLKA